jgi:potassium-transporting ATPase ATP-binding subunit
MERECVLLVHHNVLAMHGRAAEAAGNIDVLLLDKTGTIILGSRQATAFIPAEGVDIWHVAEVAQLVSLADETPESRSIVVLAKQYRLRAHTRALGRAQGQCAATESRA